MRVRACVHARGECASTFSVSADCIIVDVIFLLSSSCACACVRACVRVCVRCVRARLLRRVGLVHKLEVRDRVEDLADVRLHARTYARTPTHPYGTRTHACARTHTHLHGARLARLREDLEQLVVGEEVEARERLCVRARVCA